MDLIIYKGILLFQFNFLIFSLSIKSSNITSTNKQEEEGWVNSGFVTRSFLEEPDFNKPVFSVLDCMFLQQYTSNGRHLHSTWSNMLALEVSAKYCLWNARYPRGKLFSRVCGDISGSKVIGKKRAKTNFGGFSPFPCYLHYSIGRNSDYSLTLRSLTGPQNFIAY